MQAQIALLKVCKGCGEEKWVSEFSRHRIGLNGLRPRCKPCCATDNKAWRRKNSERVKLVNARYRDANRESLRAYNRAWNKRNRDRHDAGTKRWRQRHPLAYKAQKMRHRSLKRKAIGAAYATVEKIRARIEFFGGLCVYCGEIADTLDHRIPLTRGGTGFPSNLLPACRSCNSRKRHLTEREFREGVMPDAP